MKHCLLRLAWLAIFLRVSVRSAALAAEPAESLTVRAVFEDQLPLAGMRFDAYRVAECSGDGAWSPEPRFKAYRSRLEAQSGDGEAWAALAHALEKAELDRAGESAGGLRQTHAQFQTLDARPYLDEMRTERVLERNTLPKEHFPWQRFAAKMPDAQLYRTQPVMLQKPDCTCAVRFCRNDK